MSIEIYPSKCLNCGAELSGDAKYCNSNCHIAFATRQIRAFNKEYKPSLTYTEIEEL